MPCRAGGQYAKRALDHEAHIGQQGKRGWIGADAETAGREATARRAANCLPLREGHDYRG